MVCISQASPPLAMLLECEARASGTARFKVTNLLQNYVYQFFIILSIVTHHLKLSKDNFVIVKI